jgi:hypothetical protein
MSDFRSLMQVAKHAELIRGRRCDNVDVISNCQWPACGLADLVYTDILIASHQSQFLRIGRRFEHTQIGDHHLRSRTGDCTPRALTVSVEKACAGAKIQLRDEASR